ncbi:MAG: PspA/IM30 family protein [Hyphomicrobiales bacterium]
MSIFKRIFSIGKAEAHSVVDKLEDPIKMTEQGIRDLKKDLNNSLQALAEVKSLAIRARRDVATNQSKAKEYEKKAMLLLQQAQSGQIDMAEAERLANESLIKKSECEESVNRHAGEQKAVEANVQKLESNINRLKTSIGHYENELRTLRARARISHAQKKINKNLANIDSSGTVNMLERMKEKVEQDEALSEAYLDIADSGKSLDDEIDTALRGSKKVEASTALDELKRKMNM